MTERPLPLACEPLARRVDRGDDETMGRTKNKTTGDTKRQGGTRNDREGHETTGDTKRQGGQRNDGERRQRRRNDTTHPEDERHTTRPSLTSNRSWGGLWGLRTTSEPRKTHQRQEGCVPSPSPSPAFRMGRDFFFSFSLVSTNMYF
jgi:hypothetical protein